MKKCATHSFLGDASPHADVRHQSYSNIACGSTYEEHGDIQRREIRTAVVAVVTVAVAAMFQGQQQQNVGIIRM
eukprot:459454-Karenia_brevis.AAC.1